MNDQSPAAGAIKVHEADPTRGSAAPGSKALQPRAPRFPIQTPLLYRRSGGEDWIESRTINISRSGLLFRANDTFELKTTIEMQILFPTEITGGIPANVICWGTVVRTERPSPPEKRPAMAATIVQYRFAQQ
jgi:hypothetical protein